MLHDGRHGIGLDRVAEFHIGWQGCLQQLNPFGQERAVVGEEGGGADAFGEKLERDPAHVPAGGRPDCGRDCVGHRSASSWRRRLRSNLLLGERGREGRTTTCFGTM
jgi:hypothetical protein